MRYKVMVSAPYLLPEIDRFREQFDRQGIELILPEVKERLSEGELIQVVGDLDGMICGDDRLTQRVMEAAPNLKVISKWGTGIDSIDQAAAKRLGIRICNTPGAFNEPVADQVMSYILAFARRVPWIDRRMHNGEWTKERCVSLLGRTLGVIGVGNTGSEVVRRARAFGMKLLGNDIQTISPEFLKETGLTMVGSEELLAASDFVSINCDLNPTSFHLMDRERFTEMKRTAVFINVARGGIVDEAALIAALESEDIAGAALDVFEIEPLPLDSPLRTMENVLLSPHNANSSPEHWERIHTITIENLFQGLESGRKRGQ